MVLDEIKAKKSSGLFRDIKEKLYFCGSKIN